MILLELKEGARQSNIYSQEKCDLIMSPWTHNRPFISSELVFLVRNVYPFYCFTNIRLFFN